MRVESTFQALATIIFTTKLELKYLNILTKSVVNSVISLCFSHTYIIIFGLTGSVRIFDIISLLSTRQF